MKRILGIILGCLFLFSSCQKINWGDIETYTVPKGEHASDFPLVKKGKEIYVEVFFDESCKYDPQPEGMSGWNKLIGLMPNFSDIHTNSARWVWRYNHESGEIDLAAYMYVNGERIIEYLFSTPLDIWTDLYIGYSKSMTKWMFFTGVSESIGLWYRVDEFKDKDFWWLGLYFGGNSVAPHDVTVRYRFGESSFNINTD